MKFPERDRVLIVADGPSARPLASMKIPDSIYVIAVNAAVQWVSRADAFFTLDPSPRNQHFMRDQRKGVRYFAAVPADYGTRTARCHAHRLPKAVISRVEFLQRIPGPGPESSKAGMCPFDHAIHSGNSAWGALGLAHKMNPSRIGLAGVDANSAQRTSGGHARSLSHLPWLFSTYDGSAEIMNGSIHSSVSCFPRCNLDHLIRWLQ